jgi:hypothetical protein
MNAPGETNGEAGQHDAAASMRQRVTMARERWARLPRRRRRALVAISALVLLVLLLQRRGAPFVTLNLNFTFRPMASAALSVFGGATVANAPVADEG